MPFAGRHLTSTTQERASDLLGEEGISSRGLVETKEHGPLEPLGHRVEEHPFDRLGGKRPDVDPVHAIP